MVCTSDHRIKMSRPIGFQARGTMDRDGAALVHAGLE